MRPAIARDLTALAVIALVLGAVFTLPFIAYELLTRNRGKK